MTQTGQRACMRPPGSNSEMISLGHGPCRDLPSASAAKPHQPCSQRGLLRCDYAASLLGRQGEFVLIRGPHDAIATRPFAPVHRGIGTLDARLEVGLARGALGHADGHRRGV